jgi:Leucine rich repeat
MINSLVLAKPVANCSHFQQLLMEGDAHLHEQEFLGAIHKYQAAITDCPSRAREAHARLTRVIDTMKGMIDAQRCKVEMMQNYIMDKDSTSLVVEQLQRDLENETQRTATLDSLLHTYEELLYSSGSLPQLPVLARIAHRGKARYCFVDLTGMPIDKLGIWTAGTQFDQNGFARVKMHRKKYLLDSTGTTRRLPSGGRIRPKMVKSIDWHEQNIRKFEKNYKRKKNLEVLIANSNRFSRFPRKLKRLHKLIVVNFAENRLRKIKRLTRNRALQRVNLEGNRIREISTGIRRLKALEHLNLSQNKLREITDEIFELSTLRELHIEYNHIRSVGHKIQNLARLEVLDLSFNHLDRLPLEILKLQELRSLGLTGNRFVLTKDKNWLLMIAQLKSLKLLRIGANPCSDTEVERKEIRRKMAQLLPECVVRFN